MKRFALYAGIMAVLCVGLMSCEKEKKESGSGGNNSGGNNNEMPFLEGMDAGLAVIQLTYEIDFDGEFFPFEGTQAVAMFTNTPDNFKGVSAAQSIRFENVDLTEYSDPENPGILYTHVPDGTDSTQFFIVLDDTLNWTVKGNGKAWLQDFTLKEPTRLPSDFYITSDRNIDLTQDYTVTIEPEFGSVILNTDSLQYWIFDDAGSEITKTVTSDVLEVTFTAEELSGMSGDYIQLDVSGYNVREDEAIQEARIFAVAQQRTVQKTLVVQ